MSARLLSYRPVQALRLGTWFALVAALFAGCIDSSSLSDAKCVAVCNGVCLDIQQDPLNCGACGVVCAAGQACIAGSCGTCEASTADACVALPPGVTGGLTTYALLAGQVGSSGNLDGTGTAARFNGPFGVCLNGSDLLVADSDNCVIRKVDVATGATTTLAGVMDDCSDVDGIGSSARFGNPTACALDGAGNMFVVERGGNCLVRKIVLANGTVTTVAGTACGYADGARTLAKFGAPQGVVYDASGNLYVSDGGNHAIRKVQIANGSVATIAGGPPPTPTPGSLDGAGTAALFSNPQGLYFDAAAKLLYVADYGNHGLRRVNLATGDVTTVVGVLGMAGASNGTGAAARLHNPVGLGFDGKSKLYLAENFNHDIRVVSLPDFTVTTNAGAAGSPGYADGSGTAALFNGPQALVFDGSGNYYVGDTGNHDIRKVVADTGTVTTVAGLGAAIGSTDGAGPTATFNYPYSLAFDGNDTLYLADYNGCTIRSISLSKGTVATVAGVAGATGTVDGTASAARFYAPSGIVLDGNGNLYVTDRENHTIRKVVVATGTVSTVVGSAGNAGYREGTGSAALLTHPVAIAFDAGKLYVGELDNRVVRVVPLAGGPTTTLAGAPPPPPPAPADNVPRDGVGVNANFVTITGMVAKDGILYVADLNRIRKIDVATARVETISGPGGYSDGAGVYANFSFHPRPGQLSLDANGNLLVADFNNGLLRSFSPTTRRSATIAGISGVFGAVLGPLPTSITTSPRAVVAIPNGFAFAANYGVFTIR